MKSYFLTYFLVLVCFFQTEAHSQTTCIPVRESVSFTEASLFDGSFIDVTTSAYGSNGFRTNLDYNKDGNLEVATLSDNGDILFLEGIRTTTINNLITTRIKTKHLFETGRQGLTGFVFGDMNGDGYSDLIVYDSRILSVFFNNKLGEFINTISAPATDISKIVVADFNNDRRLDIATADTIGIKVLTGQNSTRTLGRWTRALSLATGFIFTLPLEIQAAYPITSSKIGIALGGLSDNFILYPFVSAINTSTTTRISFGSNYRRAAQLPYSVASIERGEFTGDTREDLVAVNADGSELVLMKNTGITYQPLNSAKFSSEPSPYKHISALDDFFVDRKKSVMVSAGTEKSILTYPILNGNFGAPVILETQKSYDVIAIAGDIDEDGDADAVGISRIENNTSTVSLIRNDTIVCR